MCKSQLRPKLPGSHIAQACDTVILDFASPFPLRPARCTLRLETSTDLETWTTLGSNTYREVDPTSPGNSATQVSIRLPRYAAHGHKTLGTFATTILNSFGNPIEHFGSLDPKLDTLKFPQTGPIKEFLV